MLSFLPYLLKTNILHSSLMVLYDIEIRKVKESFLLK